MTPVATRPRSSTPPTVLAGLALVAVATVGVLFVVLRLSSDEPSFVGRVTIVNPHVYKVNVEVKGPEGARWTELGTVRRETDKAIEEVADQGSLWVFRFSYGGEQGGEIAVSRTALETSGWRVTVPPEVGERFRQAGLQPSAP